MALLIAILVAAFQNLESVLGENTCPVVRYTGRFKESDHVKDHALIGRSYKNLTTNTVQECFSTCIHDCRCVSYQLSGRRCELIDEDRRTAPEFFKPLLGYKYYELKQKFKKSNKYSLTGCSSQCNNGCCRYSQPCLNGGTCIDTCQNVTHKFQCKCSQGFGGRVRQFIISCSAYSKMSSPGIYPIQTTNGSRLKMYCDMTSEAGIVWTLIESFVSLSGKYDRLALFVDSPFNEGNPANWSDYRMSNNMMQHVKRDATHWRATCNYNTDGLVRTDYIRRRLSDIDVVEYDGDSLCVKVAYIDVRGINYQNCTTHFKQRVNRNHAFVDSGKGSAIGCQWDGRQGAIVETSFSWFCNNFGFYVKRYNPVHRYAASQSSTTQWWLGTERN